jgi:hypothetical protein
MRFLFSFVIKMVFCLEERTLQCELGMRAQRESSNDWDLIKGKAIPVTGHEGP